MKRLGRSMAPPPVVPKSGKQKSAPGDRLASTERFLNELLSSLPANVRDEPIQYEIVYLPHHQLIPNRAQPRKAFDAEALENLADSIQAAGGILQPILVRKIAANRYEIVAGERRWRAADLVDLDEVPCIVLDGLKDDQILVLSLIENIQRQDLNPVEEARALRRLVDEHGLSHQDIANAIGRSRSAVSNLLRLLELCEEVLQALEEGRIEMGHARALISLDRDAQRALLSEILCSGWSVRQVEEAVRRLRGNGGQKAGKHSHSDKHPYSKQELAQAERMLHGLFGQPDLVSIRTKGKKIHLVFDSLEDMRVAFQNILRF